MTDIVITDIVITDIVITGVAITMPAGDLRLDDLISQGYPSVKMHER